MLQHDRVEPMIYTQQKKLILCNFYKYYLFQSPKYGGLFYVYLINILSKTPSFNTVVEQYREKLWDLKMAPKCPICRLGAEGCQCPSICKKCLSGGILEAQGECQCCRICKNSLDECVCCKNCKRLPQTCNCSLSQATVPLAQSQSQAFTSIASVRPPDLGLVKVKGNLPIYIASLRRWSRIGGVKAELQGDVVMMHTSSNFPKLYLELET